MRLIATLAILLTVGCIESHPCTNSGGCETPETRITDEVWTTEEASVPQREEAVIEPVKDSVPSEPEEQYRLASIHLDQAINGDSAQVIKAIHLYLLAGRTIPQEVKPDLEKSVDILFKAYSFEKVLMLEFDPTHGKVFEYILDGWDNGVDHSLIRPMLNKYRRLFVEGLRKDGFNPNIRYRISDMNQFPACTDAFGKIKAMREIVVRTKSADEFFWRRHYNDIFTSNTFSCEGDGGMTAVGREFGFEEYTNLGLTEDAQRVAREGAKEDLRIFGNGEFGEVTSKLLTPPGDTIVLGRCNIWLSRISSAKTRRRLILEAARDAEFFQNYEPAGRLYELAKDSINARRMNMRLSKKLEKTT